jgi:hypothetical protein
MKCGFVAHGTLLFISAICCIGCGDDTSVASVVIDAASTDSVGATEASPDAATSDAPNATADTSDAETEDATETRSDAASGDSPQATDVTTTVDATESAAESGSSDARGDALAAADAAMDSLPKIDAVSDGVASMCPILQTTPIPAGAAASGGFSGTDVAYYGLYDAVCQISGDCVPACVTAGGTTASCTEGSQCLPDETLDGGLGCLPPTYWVTVSGALSESDTTTDAAQLILVDIPYDDPLRLTEFGVTIPDDATISGIQFDVRRATLDGNATDETVEILQDGVPQGTNYAQSGAWPTVLTYARYGGAYDTWGVQWTPADIRASGFGITITPTYTGPSAANERAYIDSVRVTVFYTRPCE